MNRRGFTRGMGIAGLSALFLAGCQKLAESPPALRMLRVAEKWSKGAQRAIIGRDVLAPEFSKADLSPDFKANGTLSPPDADYKALAAEGFAPWRLTIDGLVENPMQLTMDQLKALPTRTQITRHDCVEGWSSIGEWTGARLGPLLEQAKLKPEAKFIVFHCADTLDPSARDNKRGKYYESIDLVDAHHPQTILAYLMNGASLPVKHGAPLRLRVERQLGYKHAKYILRIEAVASLDGIGLGKGGFWEDRGYEWYAGI